jgi:hypothetical protein
VANFLSTVWLGFKNSAYIIISLIVVIGVLGWLVSLWYPVLPILCAIVFFIMLFYFIGCMIKERALDTKNC